MPPVYNIPWESIADPTRRRILNYLFSHNNDPVSVQKISHNLGISVANSSQHLKKLQIPPKLVEFRKNGVQHCYMITKFGFEIMEKVYEIEVELKQNFKLF